MFVAVARLTLQIPESGSLKAKRQVLRRVTDRVKARFNVSVAEVDDNELWQRAVIGLSVVGNDRRHVNEQIDKIIHFVEEMYVAPLIGREMELIALGDRLAQTELLGEEGEFEIPRGDRSLAEVEGIAWEDRHAEGPEPAPPRAGGRPSSGPAKKLTLDEARAKARSLRNPRDWEKE